LASGVRRLDKKLQAQVLSPQGLGSKTGHARRTLLQNLPREVQKESCIEDQVKPPAAAEAEAVSSSSSFGIRLIVRLDCFRRTQAVTPAVA